MHRWLGDLWYDLTYWASAFPLTLGFSLRTEGARYVPATGPVLVIANHQSFFDPVLVGLATRRRLCFLARETLFKHPLLARLIRSLNAVPIDQEGFAREGLRTILDQLKAGRAVLVFPEGERTHDGDLHTLRPGVHLLIKRSRAAVVPVGIAGAYDAWSRWRRCPLPAPLGLPAGPGTLAVSVGRALPPERWDGLSREQALEELLKELRRVQARAEHLRRKE
jgi:1-acyl-sn-glycerol-3-phosphate acyltransferase